MILNKRYFIVPVTVIFNLCYVVSLSPLLAQTDSIANERIPVKAKQLEAHWNVDCTDILQKTERFLANSSDKTEENFALDSDIKKCIYIYNTPNTAHYKAKPDYKQLLDKVNNISN